jgi:hypothetical protein
MLYKAKGLLDIYLNGEMVAQVAAETSERIIVKNGFHTISVRQAGKRDINFTAKFDANSQRITFSVLKIPSTLSLTKQGETALSNQTVGIGGALASVGKNLIENLPQNTSVAIISIATNNQNDAIYIINELEYLLVNSKKFTIVDRKSLDVIRSEQNFQLSGDVSDESAVSIGQMLGANVVITGSVTETEAAKSLSVKALDVKTSAIVAMAREHY